jgi:MFS family permease
VIVAIVFVTMGIGVNARTAFSLLFPPILDEFHWDRGVTAGAFSFGFVVSAILSPTLGRMMDRAGPVIVNELGVARMVAGLLLAPLTSEPWHLYLTLGVLVGGGSVCLGYSGQSLFLPHWFVRRRGLAVGLAFAGVGVGSIALLPWVQVVIEQVGWRAACTAMGVLLLVVLAPINLLVRKRPEDMGLQPDGDAAPDGRTPAEATNVVNAEWAAVDWTLARAVRTAPFWWIALAYVSALYVWYAVQVHQTKYLVEIGFSPATAAWALGLVSLIGIPGQVVLGHISDRVGREWIWTASSLGFIICYAALILLQHYPTSLLLYVMVAAQGGLGYGLTSIFGAMVAEIFQGKHYGVIFGTLMLAAIIGGAVGPWATGVLYDANGSYAPAFWICIGLSVVSAAAIWQAAPRKVRAVAGRAHRLRQEELGSRPQQ